MSIVEESIVQELHDFIQNESYPCVAARAAMARDQIKCMIAGHIACPRDDKSILEFLYRFIDEYRRASRTFYSAAVIFKQPEAITEDEYENFFWDRLQSLRSLDAKKYLYDHRVDANPTSKDFSFSLGEEAFFIIGLHPDNPRPARRFRYPAIIFNPHAQFDEMRRNDRYEKMKKIVRQRDVQLAGSINPMLADFGESSEVFQYSGKQYDRTWTCPLKMMHGEIDRDSAA